MDLQLESLPILAAMASAVGLRTSLVMAATQLKSSRYFDAAAKYMGSKVLTFVVQFVVTAVADSVLQCVHLLRHSHHLYFAVFVLRHRPHEAPYFPQVWPFCKIHISWAASFTGSFSHTIHFHKVCQLTIMRVAIILFCVSSAAFSQ